MELEKCFECEKALKSKEEIFTVYGITLCKNCAKKYEEYLNASDISISKTEQKKTESTSSQHTKNYTKDIEKSIINLNINANFWVRLLKAMTTIILAIFLVGSLAGGIFVGYNSDSFGWGLLVFLGLGFLSFLSVSLTMVFLHLAEDVSIIRKSIIKEK